MAPSMDEVDAMRPSDEPFSRKDCWVCRYIATAFFLGRILRAFLWQLPALFYGYLATVLSCPGTQSFHAKHDDDCERLLFGRCCVGDHEWSAFGFLDPKRLYDYSGTQNGNGNRICNGRNRNGCLRAKAAHLPTWLIAVGVGSGISGAVIFAFSQTLAVR